MKRKRQRNRKPTRFTSSKKTGRMRPESVIDIIKKKWSGRLAVFMFLILFAALMGLFYAFASLTPFYERYLPYYLSLNARLSANILELLGQDIIVKGASILSTDFSVTIGRNCAAVGPVVLFICAVLAFPSTLSQKIAGIITGTLLLVCVNLMRTVSLFLVGLYLPKVFELVHLDLWQGLFIFFALLFWVLWLLWTRQNQLFEQKPSDQSALGK